MRSKFKTTLFAFKNFFSFDLLALNRTNFSLRNLFFVSHNSDELSGHNLAGKHFTATDDIIFCRTEDTKQLQFAHFGFNYLWCKHSFHNTFNVIKKFVNNFKDSYAHLVTSRKSFDSRWKLYVKTIHNSVCASCKANIIFGDIADARTQDSHDEFFVLEELQAIRNGGERPLNVGAYDNINILCFNLTIHHAKQIIARNPCMNRFVLLAQAMFLCNCARSLFVFNNGKSIPEARNILEPCHDSRRCRTS